MDKIAIVLRNRYAGKAWCYNGDGIDGLHWTDATPKPTEKELFDQFDDVMAEIQAQRTATENAKQSARTKLAALGLNEAEINALVG